MVKPGPEEKSEGSLSATASSSQYTEPESFAHLKSPSTVDIENGIRTHSKPASSLPYPSFPLIDFTLKSDSNANKKRYAETYSSASHNKTFSSLKLISIASSPRQTTTSITKPEPEPRPASE